VISVADPTFHFDADPDPTFHSDADPEPTGTFQFDADPDPDPNTHFFRFGPPMPLNDPLRLPPFHFYPDPDPVLHFDVDPDPAFHPLRCGSGSGSSFPK
jgi:hypothetical protein